MASRINVSARYGTHLAPLIAVMAKTGGDVLELGMGVFSTPYLHYQCMLSKRYLVSYNNDRFWPDFFNKYGYQNQSHKIICVNNWDEAEIEKPWDVVLVDHSPANRRVIETGRLTNLARYIVIHDSNNDKRSRRIYHYTDIYPLFKYRRVWNIESNHATVLSNFMDLTNLW